MKKLSIAIPLLLTVQLMRCQSARSPLSVRYTGTVAYSHQFTDAFSGSINQAALSAVQQATAGIYGERRFMLKDLSNIAAAVALPFKGGGLGIAINYFGAENFNTSQLGLGYGKKLGDKIDIGLQFNYNTIRLSGYGSSTALNFEAGTLLHLTNKVNLGMHVYNPTGSKFGKAGAERLASIYTIAIGYDASDKLFIGTAIVKEEDRPVSIDAGLQYQLNGLFFARMGVSTATGNYFFGLGVQWKTIRLHTVSTWQAQLGFTPAIMLLFGMPKLTNIEN